MDVAVTVGRIKINLTRQLFFCGLTFVNPRVKTFFSPIEFGWTNFRGLKLTFGLTLKLTQL